MTFLTAALELSSFSGSVNTWIVSGFYYSHYELNVGLPPNAQVEALTSIVMVSGGGTFDKQSGLDQVTSETL